MGAIKHVGVGVVQYLIEQRSKGGAFTTLEDFLHRVDMRQVGKRALESLIKVGALSGLHSERDALMENLERLTSYSTDYHKAQEVGQRSLFGGDTGISEKLELPSAKKRVPQREQLGWEKELLGLYVTGRPVDRVKDKLRHAHLNIIHVMKQTLEDDDEILRRQWSDKPVRVAGEVVSMKKLTTKNSETMVIFQLEDWHDTAATIEVVMFPRTWHKVNGYFRDDRQREFAPGEIVLVDGTFDTSRESAQIIANRVDQDF
jgi:DNA polymerase-3 subunit alpha